MWVLRLLAVFIRGIALVSGGRVKSTTQGPFNRFCGVASSTEAGNRYSSEDLRTASAVAGSDHLWHYNWRLSSDVLASGVEYVPTIKKPGWHVSELPMAKSGGIGSTVKGWNEPDDAGQAGRNEHLRTDPEAFAQAWTGDMEVARSKGYTQFFSPAIAHDVCWLDYFLKACEVTPGCKDLVTHLAFHRYRSDCAVYRADPDYIGWREDLSYVLSFSRLQRKYNSRGFKIKGLVWDEIGCLDSDFSAPAAEDHQLQYMREFYRKTLVGVKAGDQNMIERILKTKWIMPAGPDAHSGESYRVGMCMAQDGGPTASEDAVRAIGSLISVAWFSISPGINHLWRGDGAKGLSRLGQEYFESCKLVAASDSPSDIVLPTHAADALNGKIVRIVNVASGNTLFATPDGNWNWGFGAHGDAGGTDGLWRVTQTATKDFRIVSVASNRALYAAPTGNMAEGLGAGSPPTAIGPDGDWTLVHEKDDNFKIVNALSDRGLYDDGAIGARKPSAEVDGTGLWSMKVIEDA